MRKNYLSAVIILILIVINGQVMATDMSARSLGMGGAFTGLADDLSSLFFNPAGLAQDNLGGLRLDGGIATDGLGEVSGAQKAYDNIGDDNFTAAELIDSIPERLSLASQFIGGVDIKTVGFAYKVENNLDVSSDKTSRVTANWSKTGQGMLGMGYQLISPPFKLAELYVGAALKLLNTNKKSFEVFNVVGIDDSLKEININGNGFELDIGLLARITELLSVGMQIENLLGSEYQLEGTETTRRYNIASGEWEELSSSNYSEKIKNQRVMRVGASIYLPVVDLTIAADIDNFPLLTEGDAAQALHIGVEKNMLFNGLSFRAGTFNQGDDSRFFTFGMGMNLSNLHLDVAVASPDNFSADFTGVLSASLNF